MKSKAAVMRSFAIALVSAPWLAWRMLTLFAHSIGGALFFFPLLFVAAIRNVFVRFTVLVAVLLVAAAASLVGGFFLLPYADAGAFPLDDGHLARVEVMYALNKGCAYRLTVLRPLEACPWLGVECACDESRLGHGAEEELRVVLESAAGRKVASLRSGERELLRVPFE